VGLGRGRRFHLRHYCSHTASWLTCADRGAAVRTGRGDGSRVVRVRSDGPPSSSSDPRSAGRHDRDRIYYSAGFRRLAGVTQVFTPTSAGYLTHNRLTHSLKVAQVARSISEVLLHRGDAQTLEALGGLDADVAEAAGLAHDIGHLPFGHIGEAVLDEYAREELALAEGFEGNAQTFRIVARLEPRWLVFFACRRPG